MVDSMAGQEKYEVNLEYFVAPESKEMLKEWSRYCS